MSGLIEAWLKIFPFSNWANKTTNASFSNVVLQHLGLNSGSKIDLIVYRAEQRGLISCSIQYLPSLILKCINFLETSDLFKVGVWKPEIIVITEEGITPFVIKRDGDSIIITDLDKLIVSGMCPIYNNQVIVFRQAVSS